MKMALESLASANDVKVQCNVMQLGIRFDLLLFTVVTRTSCSSTGTKDKGAGGVTHKVQEGAAAGQRSDCV